MPDAALENAMKRYNEIGVEIAALGARMADLKAEQERIAKFIEEWHEFAGVGGDTGLRKWPEIAPAGPLPEAFVAAALSEERKKRTTGNPKKEDVVEASREIIRERGEPVSRADLFRALKERGIELRGADPEMVLSTMLWRMRDQIVRLNGGGYWLADRPWELAGYDPARAHEPSPQIERRL